MATVIQKSRPKKSKSALKRQRQAEKRHLRNKAVKSMLKTLAKKVEQAITAKDAGLAKETLVKTMKAYDKAASYGIVHKNTASRKIARLSARVSALAAA